VPAVGAALPSNDVPSIEVDGLVVRYGDTVAVDDVSFTAEAGQVTALLGPNGAGKTSTIEVLEGFRRATAGRTRVVNLDPIVDHRALVRRIGVMLQGGGVYPGLRVAEAAELFCAYYGDRVQPHSLIERLGLTALTRRTYRQLSGGEQQRLSLALALAGDPEVLFLDEPTASVDVAGRQLVRSLIRELVTDGRTVLLTTHELDEAERIADHVVIIDHGQLVASGAPSALRRDTAGDVIRFAAPAALDVAELSHSMGAVVVEESPGEYVVSTAPSPQAVAALTAWLAERNLPLADLRAGRQRLEDVVLRLTSKADVTAAEQPARRGRSGR
jgi:ABC-2 type transport system ATP-binding protein